MYVMEYNNLLQKQVFENVSTSVYSKISTDKIILSHQLSNLDNGVQTFALAHTSHIHRKKKKVVALFISQFFESVLPDKT